MSEPTIETEMQRMLDQQAVIDIAIRYTWALDSNNWDELDDVFTPDGSAHFMASEPEVGLDAIKARVASALGHLDDSQHIVSNHQVRIDGDQATHRCYLHAQHVRRGVEGGELYVVAGRYEDDMVRTSAGWRIKRRALIAMWNDGNRAVVRPELNP